MPFWAPISFSIRTQRPEARGALNTVHLWDASVFFVVLHLYTKRVHTGIVRHIKTTGAGTSQVLCPTHSKDKASLDTVSNSVPASLMAASLALRQKY
jgi:hypothetical protein